MIRIFNEKKCDEIFDRGTLTEEDVSLIREVCGNLHKSLNLELLHPEHLKIVMKKNFTEQKLGWHLDGIISNLIICIKEPGTFILQDNTVQEIKKGYGYLVIGTYGVKNYGLIPTYHTAPLNIDQDRCLIGCVYNSLFTCPKKVNNLKIEDQNFQCLTLENSITKLPKNLPDNCPNFDLAIHYGFIK
jgi:hypothetical protein